MEIIIEEINHDNLAAFNSFDGTFRIEAKLRLFMDEDKIGHEIIEVPPTSKKYPKDKIDPSTYLKNDDKAIFFVKRGAQFAGQVRLRKHWNRFAWIEDLVVDQQFRREGLGKALINHAKQWARARNLAGLMLETQNNNVAACRFYEGCGFQLGGFDRYLYRGFKQHAEEIALFWYFLFDPGRGA